MWTGDVGRGRGVSWRFRAAGGHLAEILQAAEGLADQLCRNIESHLLPVGHAARPPAGIHADLVGRWLRRRHRGEFERRGPRDRSPPPAGRGCRFGRDGQAAARISSTRTDLLDGLIRQDDRKAFA